MTIELLPNGYYRIFDRGSKLSGLYKKDGLYHSGDLRLSITTAQKLIASVQFCAYFDRFTVTMTRAQAESASRQGDCYTDCKELSKVLDLSHIDSVDIVKELSEFGAWDDFTDHQENIIRLIWVSAVQIVEDIRNS